MVDDLQWKDETAIVNQTNIGTVSKGSTEEIPWRRGEPHMGFPERLDTIWNWTELNWTELNSTVITGMNLH